MFHWKTIVATGFAAAVAVTASTAMAEMMMSPQSTREAAMKAIGGHMKAIGAVAKGEMAPSDATVVHAMAIHELSGTIPMLFPEGSGGGDSRALPKIWSDWDGFVKASHDLGDASKDLVEAAKSGDKGKIGAALGAVGKTCGGCHKPYRAEKKS